ncbi:thymidine kinase [Sphingomonas sp. LaA6.9]|uniref:thymidine kinase n=1 Tax=Sphingomonas sp. LaA6.9 TaxID=2919914 RepID=UPI001F4F43AC|nr:thymidine kinase [Sphingomonas sp. LaA6.9]MCJ8157982.1 thymidine kinase [Sphingomonas sp. LaA6.9]
MAKLYFYYSSMNAGKSTTLLQSSFNYQERGMETMLFTAAIDDRYAPGMITSRIGLEAEATMFDAQTDIGAAVDAEHRRRPLDCILVDEAQFLTREQTMNLRVDAHGKAIRQGAQTEIGGNDRYVALCRRHYVERTR